MMYKRITILVLAVVLAAGSAVAQHRVGKPMNQREQNELQNAKVINPERPPMPGRIYTRKGLEKTLADAFPQAASVQVKGEWTVVLDEKGKKLGYAVYSSPQSDTVYGWNGQTPVMVAFDKKKVITGVHLLPNLETPKYNMMLKKGGLLDSWNGLKVKKARKKQVDAVSGATYSSLSVMKSVRIALEKL